MRDTKVLLVEDNKVLAESVSLLLREHGMTVEVAHEGRRVPGMVAHSRPDVVVLDVTLPDVSGTVVAQALRASWPELPIIFATGNARADDLHDVESDRRVLVLEKPFEMEALFAAIAKLIRARRTDAAEATHRTSRRDDWRR